MDTPDLAVPLEAPQDIVEIRAENEITLGEALAVARDASLPLGHSTLQRWAKVWRLQGSASPVKSVLVTTRFGKEYKLDRDEFAAWALKEKDNQRPVEAPQDLARPREASQDPAKPHETSRDLSEAPRVKALETEVFQLKIDLAARNQIIEMARGEMNDLKQTVYALHREVGGLEHQLLQLGPAKQETQFETPIVDNQQE
jgi:hypothetical protein